MIINKLLFKKKKKNSVYIIIMDKCVCVCVKCLGQRGNTLRIKTGNIIWL